MKVIISCLNSKYVHASLSPWCLLAGVREFSKNTYDTLVMENTINGDAVTFAKEIIDEKPHVVAFSCYIWNITKTLEICQIIKRNHDCKIVLGGPEVSYRPKDILKKYEFTDFVLSGEGEWCFPDFLNNLNGDLSLVSGLTYRKNDEIISVPEKNIRILPRHRFVKNFSKISTAEFLTLKLPEAALTDALSVFREDVHRFVSLIYKE